MPFGREAHPLGSKTDSMIPKSGGRFSEKIMLKQTFAIIIGWAP